LQGDELAGLYRELRVWDQAMQLAEAVYDLTAFFPTGERFSLSRQMQRAATSIASNIAEGMAG
jgi:four helix bundle protein